MFRHVKLDCEVPKLQQLNENGTRYYVTPEGNKYPSITTVLSEYSRAGIQQWRNRIGHEAATEITRKAATRGTSLHKLAEKYLDNEPISFKTPLEQEAFETFKPTLHRINNIHLQEQRMYSDHLRIAGTVDCIGEFDGKLSIIDFKTSGKLKKKEYIENYFMQCAAYAIMFEERYKIPVNRIAVLISVADEEPQVFVEKRDNYVEQLLHFRDLYEKKSRFSIASSI